MTAGIKVKLGYYSVVSNHSELLYSMYHQFDQDRELPKYRRQAGAQKIHINKKIILPLPFPNLPDSIWRNKLLFGRCLVFICKKKIFFTIITFYLFVVLRCIM